MRRSLRPSIVRLLALGAGTAVLAWGVDRLSDGDEVRRPERSGVSTAPPRPPESAELFVGVVVASTDVSLAFQQAGRLEQVRVRVGDRVKQGQVLAALDVLQARQELKVAHAQLIAQQAELRKAEIRQRQTRVEVERVKVLGEQVSRAELENVTFQEELASTEVAISSARVAEQSARVELLSLRLGYMELRAPFGGQVAAVLVPVGGQVGEGQAVIRLLLQEEKFRVRFAAPEHIAGRLQPGARVEVLGPTPDTRIQATVETVWPEVDIASRQVFVEASAPLPSWPGAALWVGTPVQVMLPSPGAPELEAGPAVQLQPEQSAVAGKQLEEKTAQ
ncbi:efflux RND transporter periplasmic adaptor subunit [Hyalangium rubrum]|uniref:Efflux RND transporter periplasmic adaptor subunit n=1 Tax=Hyalangium rubrum TaxID=3103134 RepID=A0ABU5HAH1_9BACT|nr:efflux RND transporter periplasmic adaptor subunit [Hyalangium sp. s54d21]MDY7230465.1 efflux RND transporter periplasmic adaptor subunit [Hyalangium sp. s54d21]